MKREVLIVMMVFLVLTLGMHHKEWLSSPIEHLKNLSSSGAYGVGFIHPFVFTVFIYLVLWIPRFFIKLIKRRA